MRVAASVRSVKCSTAVKAKQACPYHSHLLLRGLGKPRSLKE